VVGETGARRSCWKEKGTGRGNAGETGALALEKGASLLDKEMGEDAPDRERGGVSPASR